MNLMRTKTVEQSIADTEESEHQLRKELGPLQLTVFGVGVILGTGIFVLTGEAAGEKAARFPMDEQLNLPADLYSLPLRERIADEARRGAWEQVVQQIDQRTGGHVPKRQAEQLAVRAAQATATTEQRIWSSETPSMTMPTWTM